MKNYGKQKMTRKGTPTSGRRTSSMSFRAFNGSQFSNEEKSRFTAPRAGLAPLELTLSLPIMLFVMGLMIIVGTAASWKVRTVTNARQIVWRAIDPRDGDEDPHSRGWPDSARMETESGSSAIDFDPYADHAVVRGQPLSASTGEQLQVRESLFDMQTGLTNGVAELERPFPVMGNMPPRQIHLLREHPLLSRDWQFREMGLTSNSQRRILFLYPADYERSLSSFIQRYHQAALAIVQNPLNPILETLDNDDELRNPVPSGLTYNPPYGIGRAPDYHMPEGSPRGLLLNPDRVCSTNRNELTETVINPLVSATQRVPQRLTRDFLRMYRGHLAHIDRLLEIYDNPRTPAATKTLIAPFVPAMNRDRPDLEARIEQLETFQRSL
tara:strand:+ start:184684 stop:185832 length:1149 start_codon:yes stop_codon:yes gene_type:complete